MRKFFHGLSAVFLMSGVQACSRTTCEEDIHYRLAHASLEQGNKALATRNLRAASDDYLRGVAQLGNTYRLPPGTTLDDSGMGLLAAIDDGRRGDLVDAVKNRQGELYGRLSMYRRSHKCAD
jgi:hypothetical protein